jgi:hypothetical protein
VTQERNAHGPGDRAILKARLQPTLGGRSMGPSAPRAGPAGAASVAEQIEQFGVRQRFHGFSNLGHPIRDVFRIRPRSATCTALGLLGLYAF